MRSPIIEHSNKFLFDEEAVLTVGDGVGTGKVFHYVNGKYDLHQRVYRLFGFSEDTDAKFFYHWFSSHFYDRVMSMTAKTSVDSVRLEMISDMDFVAPCVDEQRSIASCFGYIDSLITLHQGKCFHDNNMVITAKIICNSACFSNTWEQRKLRDLIVEYKETVDGDCTLPILTSSKTEGVVLQEDHFGSKQRHDITGYNILPRGYCTYRNRSDGVDFTFNINKCCDKGIISKFYPVFYGNNNNIHFISLVLNHSDEVVHEIGYTCIGTGQKVLSFNDLQKMNIRIPCLQEQDRISKLFESIDNTITLHQCKYYWDHTGIFTYIITLGPAYFTATWEQRKLSEVTEEFQSGKFIAATEIEDIGEYPVFGGNGLRGYCNTYNHDGEFALIGRQGALCGNMNYSRGKAYFTEHAVAVKANNSSNTRFLFYLLGRMNLGQYSDQSAQPGLAVGKLVKLESLFPSKAEQDKIGDYFEKLDTLITLHQCKYYWDHTGIFMNKITLNPVCFTATWEQRKLGDLSSSFEYGLNAAAKEYDGENKYIRITDIDDESREFKQEVITSPDTDLSIAENYIVAEGDILLARTGASVGKSYIYKASDGLVYYAGFLIRARIKEEYNPEFVFQNTLTSKYSKFITITSMRSGQPGVNAQEYSQYEIMIPSKSEQDKISSFLRTIDNLITLHQRNIFKRFYNHFWFI